jgi:hypothetical protein
VDQSVERSLAAMTGIATKSQRHRGSDAARASSGTCMSEDSGQIVVPESFVALFVEPGRFRRSVSRIEAFWHRSRV